MKPFPIASRDGLESAEGSRDLTGAERRRVLVEWNDTTSPYPSDLTVHELIAARAERSPESIAAIHGGRRLTYRELNRQSNQLARYLKRRGVGPGSIAGIGLKSSPDLAVALLGVMKAGGACMPLDPNYPAERLAFMQEDAKVKVLLTEASLLPIFSGSRADVVCLSAEAGAIGRENDENLAAEVRPEDPAYVVYTSGSTGRPRGILLSHRGLVNHHTAAVGLYGLSASDRVLQLSSISFDIAIEEMFPTWACGAAVVFRPEGLAPAGSEFLDWLEKQRVSVLDLPTAYWHEWVHEVEALDRRLPDSLRLVIVGGEKASAQVLRKWEQLSRGRVRWINTYGPSEASVIATAYEGCRTDEFEEIPIGRPIANTRVYVLDSRLQPVPVGATGELCIGGAGVAIGYLNRPELTATKFLADPFQPAPGARIYRTGDLVRYRPDGNLEFRGRSDDQVKIRGFRVELGEVEAALRKYAGIREAVVIASEDDATVGKRLLAYFVPSPGGEPTGAELRAFLKASLPEYMVPAVYVRLDSIPLSPNGKTDRRALPDPSRDHAAAPARQHRADAVELRLTAIWEEVLRVRPIGAEDNFFDLGGHSLAAARLALGVEKAFGRRLPIMTVFEAPTIEKMAAILRQEDWAASSSSLVALQPRGSRPPFYLVHGVGGAVLRFRDLARHMGPDHPVYALQAQGLDGARPCLRRVEDMADRYLGEILVQQPSGPYYLGGYSFGGFVALEIAGRLIARGHEIAVLALVDTFPPADTSKAALLAKFLRLRPTDQVSYFFRKLRKKIRRTLMGVTLPAAVQEVRRCCYQAERQYVPKPYSGRVVLFRPREKALRGSDDPLGGWGSLALGGVEVHEIPGDHGSIVDEPNARLLARRLKECLAEAQARSEAGLETTTER
jgi:amino acid adenylation domain-containing protein